MTWTQSTVRPATIEYGSCSRCQQSTLMCPTTQTEHGLVCTDCLLNDRRREERTAPISSRLEVLMVEREEKRQRLAAIDAEIRDLRGLFVRQTSYGR